MCLQLCEVPLVPCAGPIPELPANFAEEGLRRGKSIDCFDFVPSNYCVLYAILSNMQRGSICEWGSGIGIGIGLAELLGFESHGIEIDPALAAASRRLLADFGLSTKVSTGSYFAEHRNADIYFAYCWPSQMLQLEEHFSLVAPKNSRLLICHGAEDIRCKVKAAADVGNTPRG